MLQADLLSGTWASLLADEFTQPYMQSLVAAVQADVDAGKAIFPERMQVFRALNETSFENTRVVILGQDPYPTPGHAHGLSFSVEADVRPLPKSLINIYKELDEDLGVQNAHGDLSAWARQGVLLLNSVLTVEQGNAGSHARLGWERFTDRVIEHLNNGREQVVFLLWGAYAQKKGKHIDRDRHCVIASPHPSPLSAYRGFFGSKPFSKINDYLQQHDLTPIDWQVD